MVSSALVVGCVRTPKNESMQGPRSISTRKRLRLPSQEASLSTVCLGPAPSMYGVAALPPRRAVAPPWPPPSFLISQLIGSGRGYYTSQVCFVSRCKGAAGNALPFDSMVRASVALPVSVTGSLACLPVQHEGLILYAPLILLWSSALIFCYAQPIGMARASARPLQFGRPVH